MTFRVGFGATTTAHGAQQLIATVNANAPAFASVETQLPPSGTLTRDGINGLAAYFKTVSNIRLLATQASLRDQGVTGGRCWKPGDPPKNNPKGTVLSCANWPNPSPFIQESLPLVMYPLGTAIYLDVPFNVAEFVQAKNAADTSGTFALTRAYAPGPDQATVAIKAIMDESIRAMTDALAAYVGKGSLNTTAYVEARIAELTVNEVIAAAAKHNVVLTHSVAGYAGNPIAPNNDELTRPNGWSKYRARGGFLIDRGLVEGKKAIATKPFTYLGQYCICKGPLDLGVGTPFGTVYSLGGGLDIYLQATSNQWTMTLRPHERSAFQAIVGTAADAMRSLGKLICVAAPIITQVDKGLVEEKCVDKSGKTCKKGSKNCTCTKPTSAQQMGVGVANFALNYWCSHAGGLINPQDTPIFDPNAQQPPIVAPPAGAPWWLVPVGVGIVGYLVLRK